MRQVEAILQRHDVTSLTKGTVFGRSERPVEVITGIYKQGRVVVYPPGPLLADLMATNRAAIGSVWVEPVSSSDGSVGLAIGVVLS